MKYILKSLVLTSLCASAYAARDDCKELRTYLDNAMGECKMNDNGEMIELSYVTYDEKTTEEAYKKALSYPTLKKLTFSDEYSDCKQLTYGLSNLKNLEELDIRSFRGKLAPNTLKGLTSLKKFSYDTGDSNMGGLSKENLEELGTLTNLESLTFSFTGLNIEGLKSLQNLNKVTSLTLECNGKSGMNIEGCLANLRNLKELTISYDVKNQEEIDAIAAYTNLEKLSVGFRKAFKCDNFKNLTKLNTLDLSIEDVNEVPSCVNTIPNLQKLTYNGKDIPVKNGGNNANQTSGNATNQNPATNQTPVANQVVGNNTTQTTGNNTNQTTGNNANQTTGNNANQTTGNDVNQVAGNDVNQVAGNDVNQAIGNNDQIAGNIANGNTTTTEPNDDNNVDSGVGSTIVHVINYLPVIALIFGMLL